MPSGRTNDFPESGRGLGHVTFYNFWHTIEHIFKTTWARDFTFDTRLRMDNAEQVSHCTAALVFAYPFHVSNSGFSAYFSRQIRISGFFVHLRIGPYMLFSNCDISNIWLRVLDKAKYSAFQSTLNSPIVSYRRPTDENKNCSNVNTITRYEE